MYIYDIYIRSLACIYSALYSNQLHLDFFVNILYYKLFYNTFYIQGMDDFGKLSIDDSKVNVDYIIAGSFKH